MENRSPRSCIIKKCKEGYSLLGTPRSVSQGNPTNHSVRIVKGIIKQEREQRENDLVRSLVRLGLESEAHKTAARLQKRNALLPEVSEILQNPSPALCWRSQWTPFTPNRKKYRDELQDIRRDLEKWNQKYENTLARLRLQQMRERLLREAEHGLDSLRECLKNHPMWKINVKMMWKPDFPMTVNVDKDINVRMIKRQIQEREGVDAALLQCIVAKNAEDSNDRPNKITRLPSSLPVTPCHLARGTASQPTPRSEPRAERLIGRQPPQQDADNAPGGNSGATYLHDDDTVGLLDLGEPRRSPV